MFHFRADPDAVRVLQAARIDACALANNHILDYEERGLRDTLRILERGRHPSCRRGRRREWKPPPRRCSKLKAALSPAASRCSPSPTTNRISPPHAEHPGTNYLEVSLRDETLARIANGIAHARAQDADLVVFSNHWGANFVERPSPLFRSFARRVIELGADIYYGHSAHICQGIEIHQGKPILYDTGNFIDDYAVHPPLRNDRSCLFKVIFEQSRLAPHRTAAGFAERGACRVGAR